ncbi:similar to Saccharomyces cerevisiae YPR135W CTF4 Chromatin-associated protein, required for sister chromatid cohesion [Maudiozyma saulgeensis]|uniref:Similar to Saccharomyces cerevisiae YPR135W CTF4 Chromatin-associated protein, required for sister chromatid cohesion n=1 Tax=Maudiozyma saulgeensis TaxID=1789683 RepID=A0A1X7R9N7_9SACH|nr:similar to Saccharomyces cerevisiae YPR135W CTF4 Chromatin-associated protein, required for sister chromatid cohesion [Kazachstania saulgeensis]
MDQLTPTVKKRTVFESGGKTIIALSQDENRLIAANKNGITKILLLNKPEDEPEVIQVSENLTSLKALSNERFVLTTVKGDAFEYNYKGQRETLLLRTSLPLRDCSLIHNGKTIVFASDDLELVTVDLPEDSESADPSKRSKSNQILTLPDQISQLSYSFKTNILAVSLINGNVQFYSLSSAQPNKVHQLDKCVLPNSYQSFDKTGDTQEKKSNKLDELLDDDLSDLSDVENDDEKVTDPEFVDANRICTRITWHPTGLWFAAPSTTGTVKVFTLKNYSLTETLSAETSKKLIDVQFDTTNGEYIAAIDMDNRLTVWKWKTGETIYSKQFKHMQLTNLLWKSNGESLDIILGSWTGIITTVSNVAKSSSTKIDDKENHSDDNATKSTKNGLFVDSDDDEEGMTSAGGQINPNIDTVAMENDNDDNQEGADDDNMALFGDDNETNKRKYHFDDEDDFIDDDDNGGYIERNSSGNVRKSKSHKSGNFANVGFSNLSKFKYKPMSPGATPFAASDRRYLTMNNIGYVSTVRNNGQYSITVSFFDLGRFNEYHFEDLFGYDICFLNENGTLFAQSKTGQLHYRPHNTLHSTWTKLVSLAEGEIITSIASTSHRVIVGTSSGYCTSFNEYGLILSMEKVSPIVLLTAYDYRVFIIHYSPYHGISYSLFEQSPTKSVYYQRETSLPITLPNTLTDKNKVSDPDYDRFNSTGIKSVFFSLYGDPCVFGSDNVLLVLSKWRSNTECRWLPILDTDMEIWKMTGGKEDSDVHVWPLGLTYDTLNCVLVKGKKQWPEFPLPLPSEMEVKIPVLVKSQLLEEHKLKLKNDSEENEFDRDLNESDDDQGTNVEKEITVPVNIAAEEEYVRSKVLSSLLTDTIENDGEMYGNENDLLQALVGNFDKSLLRLFAVACSSQNTEKALSIVQELKQDRALTAAAKISERAEMMTLTKRINDLRETRFEQQINNI